MAAFMDLTGQRFGGLLVLYRDASVRRDRSVTTMWMCRCDCQTVRSFSAGGLRKGQVKSCGCLKARVMCAIASATGESRHGSAERRWASEYNTRRSMIARCHNPNRKDFLHYGGRGIRVCDRWRESFENFFADMGPKPSPKHSIDRIDLNGHYEPGNCRWATVAEQMSNRSDSRYLTIDGVTLTMAEWSRRTGVHNTTIRWRKRRGFSDPECVARPKKLSA